MVPAADSAWLYLEKGMAQGWAIVASMAAIVVFIAYTAYATTLPRAPKGMEKEYALWAGFSNGLSSSRIREYPPSSVAIWGRIMARLDERSGDWPQPPGVESRIVDDQGSVYTQRCAKRPRLRTEYFVEGTAPKATCGVGNAHVPPEKKRWLQRFWRR